MTKTLALVLALAFAGGALTGCGDPCEKVVKKVDKCFGKDKDIGEMLGELKKVYRKSCEKDKAHAKKCLKKDSCKAFEKCLEKK
jgi:hypothetical protein